MSRLFVILIFFYSNTLLANWFPYSETELATHFSSDTAIINNDGKVLVWEMQNLKKDSFFDSVKSYRFRSEYDCELYTYRVMFYTSHTGLMGMGEQINYIQQPGITYAVIPGTPSDFMFKKVCGINSVS